MDLLKKREEIIAEHKNQVKHDPAWKNTNLAERPVAFVQDTEIVLVGDCASLVLAGLKKYVDLLGSPEGKTLRKRGASEAVVNRAATRIGRILDKPPADELRVNSGVWNDFAFALNAVGIDVVLAEGSED